MALAARTHVYELERLGYTDAATAPPPPVKLSPAERRARLWAAMRHWVLSRL